MILDYLPTGRLSLPEQLDLDLELMAKVGQGERPATLRFWEFSDEAVILGLSQEEEKYVNLDATQKDGIPVLRRFSGGGTVFLHQGCLVYSLFYPAKAPFKRFDVQGAYLLAFAPLIKEFAALGLNLQFHEPCDLAIDGRKVAGSAQSQRKGAILVHGSFLVNPDLTRLARYLKEPDIRPDYRKARNHEDFLLPLSKAGLDEEMLRSLFLKAYCSKG